SCGTGAPLGQSRARLGAPARRIGPDRRAGAGHRPGHSSVRRQPRPAPLAFMLMETARGASAFARAGMCVIKGEGHAVPIDRAQVVGPLAVRASVAASNAAEMTAPS